MIYKEYGSTGKMVSAVGFGGMRFDIAKDEQENIDLVHYASHKGINYFDTAPGYCSDQSEFIMGKALSQMKREDYFVSTKMMPTAGKCKQDFIDGVKKSLDRLKSDYIDFYHIWCLREMAHYHLAMQEGMQYDALLECQQMGLIKHIVCSSHQSGSEIKQIADDGKVEGILMGINILNSRYRWKGVEACVENGLGIVAMNPLSGGVIPQNEDKLQYLSRGSDTPTQAALRFCISSPITVTLNGFSNTEHIDMACDIADDCTPYTQADLESISKSLGDNMNSLCTGCGYCLKGCPMDINIPAYMQFYNKKLMWKETDEKLKDQLQEGEYKWGTLVGSPRASACIECGACEEACTQHLDIIERLRYINEKIDI
ncbi:MAG: aldo/keto reductase [Eubacteriales bacterium]